MATSCPVCARHVDAPFVEIKGVPVHVSTLHRTPDGARTAFRGDLELVFCESCGFIWNAAYDADLVAYDTAYENSLDHSPAFVDYVSALAERLVERYGLRLKSFAPVGAPDRLWERDPDACCGMRKVTPLEQALAAVDAWITGLRRDQSPARAGTPKLGWDAAHGKWKAAPLADWTDKDVWRYIVANDVPYNSLHDRGFASIGCTHCTVPGAGRDGRWAGTDRIECGLHLPPTT